MAWSRREGTRPLPSTRPRLSRFFRFLQQAHGSLWKEICLILSSGPLAAGVVLIGVPLKEKLGDGDNGEALALQRFQNSRQGLGRVLGGVVEEDDAAGAHILQDPLGDLIGRDALPVQTVAFPYS